MKLTYGEYSNTTLISTVTKLIILDINMTSSAANTVPEADIAITCAAYDAAIVQSYQWYKGGQLYSGGAKQSATYNAKMSRTEVLMEYLGVASSDAGEFYCSVIFHSFSLAMSAIDSTGITLTTLSVLNIRTQPEELTFITPGYVSFITCVTLWPSGVAAPFISWSSSTGLTYTGEGDNITDTAEEINAVRYMQSVFQTPSSTPVEGTTYTMNITFIEIHGPGTIISEASEIKLRAAGITKISLNKKGASARTYPAFEGGQLKITCQASSNAIVPKESVR